MIVETAAGPVELDERGIPPSLRQRVRSWFHREACKLEQAHGPNWPASKVWLAGQLRSELRDLVEKELPDGP